MLRREEEEELHLLHLLYTYLRIFCTQESEAGCAAFFFLTDLTL